MMKFLFMKTGQVFFPQVEIFVYEKSLAYVRLLTVNHGGQKWGTAKYE